MPKRITLHVDRDGLTGKLQLGISEVDENGAGGGYRIAGPKYSGTGKNLLTVTIDTDTAAEIRGYLDRVVDDRMWAVRFENGNLHPERSEETARWLLRQPSWHVVEVLHRDGPDAEWVVVDACVTAAASERLEDITDAGDGVIDCKERA